NEEALRLRKRAATLKVDGAEGNSERAIRCMLGLPYDDASIPTSSETMDTPLGEIKDVVNKQGTSLMNIKVNQVARNLWAQCRATIEKLDSYGELNDEQRLRISEGKITV